MAASKTTQLTCSGTPLVLPEFPPPDPNAGQFEFMLKVFGLQFPHSSSGIQEIFFVVLRNGAPTIQV